MKKLKVLAVLALSLVVLISCESDSNSTDTSGDLLGTWNMVEFDYSGTSSAEFQGIPITTTYEGVGTNMDATMMFTEDPNELMFEGSYDIELTFEFSGQTQTQTFPINDAQSTTTWSRNGNILTIEEGFVSIEGSDLGDVESQEYTIQELTANTLILTSNVTQELTQQGVTSTVTLESYIRFTR